MTELNRAGQSGSLGDVDISQDNFVEQINALTDGFRQLGGNAQIMGGSSVVNNPLNAPFLLYVDPYIGRDTFVAGDYSSTDDGTFDVKMQRISNQRLECGYTPSAPFRTLGRAAIEAAIITSRSWMNLNPAPCGDNVTVVVQSGEHVVFNGPGLADSSENFPEWSADKEPTTAELQAFNPEGGSGVIFPRGVSVVSMDLRKCRLTPDYVPTPGKELYTEAIDGTITLLNRAAMLRVTGGAYVYGYTFADKIGYQKSHHLLSTIEAAGQDLLTEFYSKIRKAFGTVADLNDSYVVQRSTEAQITTVVPAPGLQTSATDSTHGSSPYIYNCSIRSNYGLCGIVCNGAIQTGLKSMVIAQFTGVSLQKDMTCWQHYVSGDWVNYAQDEYDDYINEAPDNVRMDPEQRSFHIRCLNRSIIQEVSVFCIGQAIHHWVQSGGEITCTNSNSNFGGCASLAEGTLPSTFATDLNWNVSSINVARGFDALNNSWRVYDIGEIKSNTENDDTTLTLTDSLEGTSDNEPDVIADSGYSLNNYGGTSYIWLDNPNGTNYYAPLADNAWDPTSPNTLRITTKFKSANDDKLPSSDPTSGFPPIAGLKVFIRRLVDTRSIDERFYTLTCKNTSANSRNMVRDYILQTDNLGTSIDAEIPNSEAVLAENIQVQKATGAGVFRVNKFSLRRAAASADWDSKGEYRTAYHLTNPYYRPGDVVRYQNKHFKCIREHAATANFESQNWDECFVHMDSDYATEDYFKNIRPIIVFDSDKSKVVDSELLGYTNSDWDNDQQIYQQLRTSSDYLGLYSFLRSLGFDDQDSHTILLPKSLNDRERDPVSALDGIGIPSGVANTWANWPVGARRPSQIRLFSHSMEWAGYLNYTKALPQYQRDLSPSNKFTYYFTNSGGGRVYISAFNEEGFQITAGGLIDLLTGEQISPEGLGGSGAPSDVTIFNGTVVINGTLEADRIESNQKALVALGRENGQVTDSNGDLVPFNKDNDAFPSDGRGMAWIAPAQAITGTADVAWDYQNQTGQLSGGGISNGIDGFSGPNFITPAWLERWKGENSLLGNVPGPINIFVNPRAVAPSGDGSDANSAENESFNWNANLSALFQRPPTSPQNAVRSLRLAIQFADLYVSTTTQVRYYLGCGIYQSGGDSAGSFDFRHPIRLYGYDFATNQFISNGYGGGPYPFMGTTNGGRGVSNSGRVTDSGLEATYKNADRAPVFVSSLKYYAVTQGSQSLIDFQSPSFRFRKSASMYGVVIWGVTDTLQSVKGTEGTSDQTVANSIFDNTIPNAAYQNIKNQNRDKVLNAYVYELMQARADSSNNDIDYIQSKPVFTVYDTFVTREVAIGAGGLPYDNYGNNSGGMILTVDNGSVDFNGCYLVGNNQLDSTGYTYSGGTEAPTPTFRGQGTYFIFGCRETFIATSGAAAKTNIRFCSGSSIWIGYNRCYNLTSNNNHLITSEFKYMADDDTILNQSGSGDDSPTDDPLKQGPSFEAFFSGSCVTRRLGGRSYRSDRVANNSYRAGWAGYFGRNQTTYDGGPTTGWRVMGLSALTNSAAVNVSPSNSTPSNGPLGSIRTGTTWDYLGGPAALRKNGSGTGSVISPTFDNPNIGNRIIANNHTYSTNGYYLNVKYATVATGQDYASNYLSNRLLLA